MESIKLNLGCGKDIRDGYTNMDIDPISDKVVKHDVEDLSDFADSSVSEILAFDIIEHFPLRKINPIIREWCRVLRPEGRLIIQTPDIEVIFKEYYKQALAGRITWTRFSMILHGKDEPFQTHYVSLSFQWLKEILEQYNMTVVTKETIAQNMKVIAAKNAVSAQPSQKAVTPVTAPKHCKRRLRIVRTLRYLCRRHGFMKSLWLDRLSDFIIRFIILPTIKNPVVVPVNHGFDLIVDPKNDIGLEKQIFETGTYETGTLHVIGKCLTDGDTFLDVGSNIGLMSIHAAKFVGEKGKVHAFEPEPQTFAILKRNIEINGFNNIEAHDFALGSSPAKAAIFREIHNRAAASFLGPLGNTTGGKEVSICKLDDFVMENNLSTIKMIKINVEGWELEVLKGAENVLTSRDAPIICIDYSYLHPTHGGLLKDVYDTICDSNDYKVFKLQHGKNRVGKLVEIKGPEHLPSFDNLFCLLPKHLSEMETSLFVG